MSKKKENDDKTKALHHFKVNNYFRVLFIGRVKYFIVVSFLFNIFQICSLTLIRVFSITLLQQIPSLWQQYRTVSGTLALQNGKVLHVKPRENMGKQLAVGTQASLLNDTNPLIILFLLQNKRRHSSCREHRRRETHNQSGSLHVTFDGHLTGLRVVSLGHPLVFPWEFSSFSRCPSPLATFSNQVPGTVSNVAFYYWEAQIPNFFPPSHLNCPVFHFLRALLCSAPLPPKWKTLSDSCVNTRSPHFAQFHCIWISVTVVCSV